MTRRALILPLVTLAAAAVPSGSALADQTPGEAMMSYTYAVTVEGTADYSRHFEQAAGGGTATEDAEAHLAWTTQIPVFQFFGTMPTSGSGNVQDGATVGVDFRASVPEAEYTDTGACASGTLDGGASTVKLSDWTKAKGYLVQANVLTAGKIKLGSCSGMLKNYDGSISLSQNLAENGAAPWTQTFDMPPEAVGQGKIIQLLDRTVTGVDCPGHRPGVTSCTLNWHAKLTFVKTAEDVLIWPGDPDDLLVPIPPGAGATPTPAPAPAPTPAPATTPSTPTPGNSIDFILSNVRKAATLATTGASATLPVSCPSGCSGTAIATAASSGHASAAAARTLGRASFSVKPKGTKKVTLRFGAKARRAIRKAGAVKVAVRVKVPGAAAKQQTITLRLRHR